MIVVAPPPRIPDDLASRANQGAWSRTDREGLRGAPSLSYQWPLRNVALMGAGGHVPGAGQVSS